MRPHRRPFGRSPLFRRFESAARRGLGDAETERLLRDATRYARSYGIGDAMRSAKERLFTAIMRRLGPLGRLFSALLRPGGRRLADPDKELAAAGKLMEAFPTSTNVPAREQARAKAALGELLERQGFRLTPPPPTSPPVRPGAAMTPPGGSRRPSVEFDEFPGPAPRRPASNVVEVRIGSGIRRFKQSDPLVTGEMIPVTSSNVHSIGYEFNWDDPAKGSLKVRFLQDGAGGKKSGPGPLYYYYGVHPDLFLRFRLAASKGRFVWDKLRVRGTVSGHQYPYELVGVTNGRVPRKATRFGPNEYFVPRAMKARSVRTGEVRTLESRLPARLVNRGRPNRGKPNRGRP